MKKRPAFSLLEIIAAVIILAVVATATIATVAPMRSKSDAKIDEATMANLNSMAQTFYLEQGRWPNKDGGIGDLVDNGYLDDQNNQASVTRMKAKFSWDDSTKAFKAVSSGK